MLGLVEGALLVLGGLVGLGQSGQLTLTTLGLVAQGCLGLALCADASRLTRLRLAVWRRMAAYELVLLLAGVANLVVLHRLRPWAPLVVAVILVPLLVRGRTRAAVIAASRPVPYPDLPRLPRAVFASQM